MYKWHYEIGDRIKTDNKDLTVIDREWRPVKGKYKESFYNIRCNICGWDQAWKKHAEINGKYKCSCCNHHTLVRGINDIGTTDPDKVKYFANKEDAYNNFRQSSKYVLTRCPICGNERKMRIDHLIKLPYSCPQCGVHSSMGERFVYALLKQNGIDFIYQLNKKDKEWCDKYRYDFYIPCINMIVEVNGKQHIKDGRIIFNQTQREIFENDADKF